jgi:hypothetical protein
MELPDKVNEPVVPAGVAPIAPATMEQIPSAELADLRRRAEKYRFLFKTIVTVTGILVGATLIVVLAALLTDL